MNKNKLNIKPYGIRLALTLMIICGTWKLYALLNDKTNQQAPLLFTKLTMLAYSQEVLNIDIEEEVATSIKRLSMPLALVKQTMPFSKLIDRGSYEEELSGHFHIPEEEELITLEKDNLYTPDLPTPIKQQINLDQLSDPQYLLNKIYTGDRNILTIDEELFEEWDFKELAQREFRIDESVEGPKVLVFHTHAKELFADEETGDLGVVAVGNALEEILEEEYGIETLHVTDHFYENDTTTSTDGCYERMEAVIQTVLDQNPSIQICIDLHRDGIEGDAKVTGDLNGEEAAKIMFVNGMTRQKNQAGENVPMKSLVNPYLEDNLAFSLQMQIEGMKYYPQLMRKIYLKGYRYSLNMKPMSLLIEIGAQNETSEEAIRTAEPIAHLLAKVLEKD